MSKAKVTAIKKGTGEIIPLKQVNKTMEVKLKEDITITDQIDGTDTRIILDTEQQKAFESILSNIAQGMSLYQATKQQNTLSLRVFYNIINIDAQYRYNYARATEERERVMFEQTLVIATDNSNDMYLNEKGVLVPNPVAVQRARLQCDVIDKMLARMNHKKYGNRSTIGGDKDNPIIIQPITGMIIE